MDRANNRGNDPLRFEIREQIGVIAEYPSGWCKEVNMVAWNDAAPKYDIRDWDPNHEHMSRGITLHAEEMKKLSEIIKGLKM